MMSALPTPLWPAGNLPLKGGDRQLRQLDSSCDAGGWRKPSGRLISTLEGEIAGRPDGGVSAGGAYA
jgi:hypothetical protein